MEIIPLVTPEEVKVNASHLTKVDDVTLSSIITDVHISFILDAYNKHKENEVLVAKLKVIEKLLSQHMATLNVRRADSESIGGMSKSISVVKGMDLEQTEYGQMAKKLAIKIPLDWANNDMPASVVIF